MDTQTHDNTLCACTYGVECHILTIDQIEGIAPLPLVRSVHERAHQIAQEGDQLVAQDVQ